VAHGTEYRSPEDRQAECRELVGIGTGGWSRLVAF
jgi:hypothetical protein